MRAGILTFHRVNNYGAVLQNYALQRALEKCGCEAETIDYECDYIERPYRFINLKTKGFKSYLMGVGGHIVYGFRGDKTRKFRKLLKLSPPLKRKDLDKLNGRYDIFIAGSDQVWNYKLSNFDHTYFLDFVKNPAQKASYAASFGLDKIDKPYREEYKKMLNNFQHLSVRENTGAKIMEELIGRKPTVVIDPSMLLTEDEWCQVLEPPKYKHDYILVYQLGFCTSTLEFVQQMAKRINSEVVCLPFPMGKFIPCHWGLTKGPAELLGLIKNAKYVVTSSYHGMMFSILFHKQFYVEIPSGISQVKSRVEDVLSEFKLQNRIVRNGKCNDQQINYEKIDPILCRKREESMIYLKKIVYSKG